MKTSYSFTPIQHRSSDSVLFFLSVAAVVVLAMAGGIVKADPGALPEAIPGAPPVVVDSIEPTEIVQGQAPQPELKIFGSNFIEGLPSESNRPTVTLRQPGKGGAEFSVLAWVNFAGTVATVPPQMMNLLQAPLGVYDVIVTRPSDNASATLKGAFTVTDGQPDPGEIALVARSIWGGPVNDVEVVGNLAYAAIGRRLVILDISDASNPTELGSLNLGGVNGLAVRDGYAFVGAGDTFGFSVVDVSDPSNPSLVWARPGSTRMGVHLWGDFAFVRGHTGNVRLFDITDPLNTAYVDSVVVDEVGAMVIVGDLMYVGTSSQCCQADLKIYDLASDPLNPILLGSIDNVGKKTTGLAVEGDYLAWTVRHLGNPKKGPSDNTSLHVVDVSDPQLPVIVGSYDHGPTSPNGTLQDVALSGGYAYVANAARRQSNGTPYNWAFAEGLIVFDIATDPTNPTIVSTFKTHGNVTGVEIVGNRAYVHDDGEGLIILDVTDPTKPVRLGNYYSPAVLRQMAKEGDLLYVSDAWNGFTVLDVSDASHPQVVGVYLAEHIEIFDVCRGMIVALGVDAWGIDVQDDLVYLSAGFLGLEVVDVSDPSQPTLLGAFRIPNPLSSRERFDAVNVSGGVAHVGFYDYITCGSALSTFLNLDITSPQSIFELGRVVHSVGEAKKIVLNQQSVAFIGRGIDGEEELTIDTSNPADPIIINEGDNHSPRMDDILEVADVALDGNTLFLAAPDDEAYVDENGKFAGMFESGLYIQDVTDPANPVVLLQLDEDYLFEDGDGNSFFLRSANAVAIQNQRVYVAASLNGPGGTGGAFGVLDMADLTTPVLLDVVRRTDAGGPQSAVIVDEPHVFVTNESQTASAGLAILELVGLLNPADLDGDGTVGVKDLLILLGDWGPCDDCTDCPADLDGDCTVGVKDLLILLGNWG